MMLVVIGGSGSGKSAYAESRAMSFAPFQEKRRIYLATMENFGPADQARIDRHRRLRAGKDFVTVEKMTNLADLALPEDTGSVLLECVTSLAGNELYHSQAGEEAALTSMINGLEVVREQTHFLTVVTDNVFADGITYDEETMAYIRLMGRINRWIAQQADEVEEVVCGIPLRLK